LKTYRNYYVTLSLFRNGSLVFPENFYRLHDNQSDNVVHKNTIITKIYELFDVK